MIWNVVLKQNTSWTDLEKLQSDLIEKAQKDGSEGFLLFSEPHSTFTCGRNAPSDDLVWSPSLCAERKVAIERVSRGGRWTYHGPGQILCYPIANLADLKLDKKEGRRFTEIFRTSALDACLEWGIPAAAQDDPFGIFVGSRKLASFGLSFQRGISSHGMALYLSPQQEFFSGIHACGVPEQSFTCLHDYNPRITWGDAARLLAKSIEKGFKTL